MATRKTPGSMSSTGGPEKLKYSVKAESSGPIINFNPVINNNPENTNNINIGTTGTPTPPTPAGTPPVTPVTPGTTPPAPTPPATPTTPGTTPPTPASTPPVTPITPGTTPPAPTTPVTPGTPPPPPAAPRMPTATFETAFHNARADYLAAFAAVVAARQADERAKPKGVIGWIKNKLTSEKVATGPANDPVLERQLVIAEQTYNNAKYQYYNSQILDEKERLEGSVLPGVPGPQFTPAEIESQMMVFKRDFAMIDIENELNAVQAAKESAMPPLRKTLLRQSLESYNNWQPTTLKGKIAKKALAIGLATAIAIPAGGLISAGLGAAGGALGVSWLTGTFSGGVAHALTGKALLYRSGMALGGTAVLGGIAEKLNKDNSKHTAIVERAQNRGELALAQNFDQNVLQNFEARYAGISAKQRETEKSKRKQNMWLRIGLGTLASAGASFLAPHENIPTDAVTGNHAGGVPYDPNYSHRLGLDPWNNTPDYTTHAIPVSSMGFNTTMEQLQHQFQVDHPGVALPPELQGSGAEIAQRMGMFRPGATDGMESGVVPAGSTISIDNHGNMILHNSVNGQDEIINKGAPFHDKFFHYTGNDAHEVAGNGTVDNTPQGGLAENGNVETNTQGDLSGSATSATESATSTASSGFAETYSGIGSHPVYTSSMFSGFATPEAKADFGFKAFIDNVYGEHDATGHLSTTGFETDGGKMALGGDYRPGELINETTRDGNVLEIDGSDTHAQAFVKGLQKLSELSGIYPTATDSMMDTKTFIEVAMSKIKEEDLINVVNLKY